MTDAMVFKENCDCMFADCFAVFGEAYGIHKLDATESSVCLALGEPWVIVRHWNLFSRTLTKCFATRDATLLS